MIMGSAESHNIHLTYNGGEVRGSVSIEEPLPS